MTRVVLDMGPVVEFVADEGYGVEILEIGAVPS
jgi:hypothetical protein